MHSKHYAATVMHGTAIGTGGFRKAALGLAFALALVSMGCATPPGYAPPDPCDLPVFLADDEPEYAAHEPEVEKPMDTGPIIALTFDDGPGWHTDRILDVLERYGGRATFFVVGSNVEPWRNTVIRTVGMGSEVVGHTWSHPPLTRLSSQRIAEEIQTTSAIIEQVTGFAPPRFFRPPFGLVNQRVANVSAELGYAMVNWTLDTEDWDLRNADLVYDIIMRAARDGSIVLLHDIHETTAAAVERAIPALIAKGFRLVTVSELLYRRYGNLEPGREYGYGIRGIGQ